MYVIAVNHEHGTSYWTGRETGFGSIYRSVRFATKKDAKEAVTKQAKRWILDQGMNIQYYPEYSIPYVKEIEK